MAVMRKEQRDIDALGPIGIFRESLKVFCAHAKVFALIQLALMLDLAILVVIIQYFVYKNVPQPQPQPDPEPDHGLHCLRFLASPHLARHLKMSDHGGSVGGPVLNMVLLVVVTSACSIAFQAALCLSLAATIYAVGLHYAGKAVSFVDVVWAATPRLWMRLALTNTYANLTLMSFVLVESVGSLLLIQYNVPMLWLATFTLALACLMLVGSIFIQMIFSVAAGVSVLDEDYGWASVSKSLKLLKEKTIVALLFQLLFCLLGGVSAGFQYALRSQIDKDDYSPLTLTILFLALVVYVGWTTFLWQFQAVTSAVQYVSFKAYHDETLAASLYEKGTTKEGYESIEDGSNTALLGV